MRFPHIEQILRTKPSVDWFEVHICNYLTGALPHSLLEQITKYYPVSFHSVSLNLGGVDALDTDYLALLKQACDRFQPALVSDHLCFCRLNGEYFHDLLPLPYTQDGIDHVVNRIMQVQEYLGKQILIENPSRYVSSPQSHMKESEFLSEVSIRSGCGLLLDINNAYLNQMNLNEEYDSFLSDLPLDRIEEIHIAGHREQHGLWIDTHDRRVADPVWALYAEFCQLCDDVPCLIEWDSELPDLHTLLMQMEKAKEISKRAKSQSRTEKNWARG